MRHRLLAGIALIVFGAGAATSQNLGERLGRRLGDALRERLGGIAGTARPVRARPATGANLLGTSSGRRAVDDSPDDGTLIAADGTIALDQAEEAVRRIRRVANAEHERHNECAQRMWQQHRAAGERPWGSLPDNEKAACVAEADLGTIALRNAVVLGAQRRADAAPATIEGLRSLRELDSGYRSVFAGPARFQAGGPVESVWLAVQPVISRRRAAIEGPLRPQVIARMNSKDGGPGFIDSLFGYDDTQRKAAYALLYEDAALIASIPKRPGNEKLFFERTTDIAQSSRERTQAAGFAGWTEPTSNEMGLALMRVALNTGGRQISTSVVSVGTAFDRMGFDVFSGSLKMYSRIYEVRKTACRREVPGYRCSYRSWIRMIDGAGGSGGLGGSLATSMVNGVETAGRLFVPTRSGWYAPENEAAVTKMQTAQLQQLSDTASRIADAGAGAMSVLADTRSGSGVEPGEDSQAEQERKLRVEQAERRR